MGESSERCMNDDLECLIEEGAKAATKAVLPPIYMILILLNLIGLAFGIWIWVKGDPLWVALLIIGCVGLGVTLTIRGWIQAKKGKKIGDFVQD